MRLQQLLFCLTPVLMLLPGCGRSPDSLLQSAATKYKGADYRGVIADSSEAIRKNPNRAEPYLWRGTARAKLGDADGAIADLDEAIRLNPKNPKAYCSRSV